MSLSDHYESGTLFHIFHGQPLPQPDNIAVALTNAPVLDNQNGLTLDEIPQEINGSGTGYSRISLGNPAASGDETWKFKVFDRLDESGNVVEAGVTDSGVLVNKVNVMFNRCLIDWGTVSGLAILDHASYGSGNVIVSGQLKNPRPFYEGDRMVFDPEHLEIHFN